MIISLTESSKKYSKIAFDVIQIFYPHLTWQELMGDTSQDKTYLDIKISSHYVEIRLDKQMIRESVISDNMNETKRTIKLGIYKLLKTVFNHPGSPWGILTGIRPTKIVHRLWDQGYQKQEIADILQNRYEVSFAKTNMLIDTTEIQRPFLLTALEALKSVGIYISIPFCPTRCSYCSFPAFSMARWGNKVNDYLENLKWEIKEIGKALKEQDFSVQTIYVGGGTPTTLTSFQLADLLEIINNCLKTTKTIEFTVEAGRPDTIDKDKLLILKKLGVDRISINPQTMWAPTLNKIGRAHTVEEVFEKMDLAKKLGFKVINMDLIIGLPGENLNNFNYTLKQIEKFNPENITFHTLAIKRAARLKEDNIEFAPSSHVEEMFDLAQKWTEKQGYQPYYLYRQKQILANLENVGYCLPNRPCLYNIQMMEERQTIWGLGVGAGSKVVDPFDWTLVNSYNPKDLLIYNQRIAEIIKTKVDKIKGLG